MIIYSRNVPREILNFRATAACARVIGVSRLGKYHFRRNPSTIAGAYYYYILRKKRRGKKFDGILRVFLKKKIFSDAHSPHYR